jgi:cyclopropane fatty-acyl-phospholipid synthase-like methyltransferase
MKVLDMGCGRGCSSIFLAKEYGVTVFATDLWIPATENLRRVEAAGVADLVFPIHAEAHALPYAEGFFDAAVSLNSYHYYGTADTYFPQTYSKLVKPGGQFGVVIDGYIKEDENDGGAEGFHSGAWWRRHWEKTGLVEITACYDFDDPKSADERLYADDKFDTTNFALIVMAVRKKP